MKSAALIVGAAGGIGQAMVDEFQASAEFDLILGTSRRPGHGRQTGVLDRMLPLDFCDESSIDTLINQLQVELHSAQASLNTVLICSGLLHSQGIRPERRAEDLSAQAFEQMMRVNALGPLQLLAQLKTLIPRDQASRIAAISARVGSISDNRLGGWYSYRCSKAALNMGFRNLAIELKRSHAKCVPTLFHPGTVDTPLSEPFQANVAADKLFSPQRAAQQFWFQLRQRQAPGGDLFIDWAGKPIAF